MCGVSWILDNTRALRVQNLSPLTLPFPPRKRREREMRCSSFSPLALFTGDRLHDRSGSQQHIGLDSRGHKVDEPFRKARVRSHARLAAAGLYACETSDSKNQCPVPA